jgi:hypothetical protein
MPANAAKEATAWGFGGNESCASWQAASPNEIQGEIWILGYWSGRNVGERAMVGASTDAAGIWAEVKNYCAQQPSASLFEAAGASYNRLKAEHR